VKLYRASVSSLTASVNSYTRVQWRMSGQYMAVTKLGGAVGQISAQAHEMTRHTCNVVILTRWTGNAVASVRVLGMISADQQQTASHLSLTSFEVVQCTCRVAGMRRGGRVKSPARARGSAALASSRPNTVVYLQQAPMEEIRTRIAVDWRGFRDTAHFNAFQ
jgi:hypothetical protein